MPRYQPGLNLRSDATDGDPLLQLVRSDAVAVMNRLLAHVENGTTDQAADVMREPVERSEVGRQELRRYGADVSYPQSIEQP